MSKRQPLAFEELLVRLSARFVNLPANQVDRHIEDGLRQIVEFLELDRSTFGVFNRDGLEVTHSYGVAGLSPIPRVLLKELFPWLTGELLAGRAVRIEEALEQLPREAVLERDYCLRTGLHANLTIPISVGGAPQCAISVASFRGPRRWSNRLVSRLQLIGEVFANAVARGQLDQARHETDERCRRLRNELAHAGRVTALGEMAASLAHEVNQPLCAILANARSACRLLGGDPPDLQEALAAVEDIAADAERTRDIVARTRALLQKSDPEPASLEMNALIEEVVALARHDLSDRKVALRVQLGSALPLVCGDRVQLQQVILNLVLNAAEAMDAVPVEQRELTISSEAHGGEVRAVVRDRGPGIDPALAELCFEPFFSTKPGGMGMGLAICRSIVDAHDGRLEARMNGAWGAAFAMILPAAGAGS